MHPGNAAPFRNGQSRPAVVNNAMFLSFQELPGRRLLAVMVLEAVMVVTLSAETWLHSRRPKTTGAWFQKPKTPMFSQKSFGCLLIYR
ncbi:MAG: hypothetical protein ABSF38_16135 [Verrucomicrobiota bacterium]|jgi:hypothetical protein